MIACRSYLRSQRPWLSRPACSPKTRRLRPTTWSERAKIIDKPWLGVSELEDSASRYEQRSLENDRYSERKNCGL